MLGMKGEMLRSLPLAIPHRAKIFYENYTNRDSLGITSKQALTYYRGVLYNKSWSEFEVIYE